MPLISTYSSFLPPPAPHLYLHSSPTRRSPDLLLQSTESVGRPPSSSRRPIVPEEREMDDETSVNNGNPRDETEEHTSELQSRFDLVCRLLLEKKKNKKWR